ncbi:MAG: hypothetical protein NHB15_01470 [Methanosarcina barkeri]|nr:hypothetical protein [Methanosarcina sp. ERenArc_MAG2]
MKYKATHPRIIRGEPIHKTLEETKPESNDNDLKPIKELLLSNANLKNSSEEKSILSLKWSILSIVLRSKN